MQVDRLSGLSKMCAESDTVGPLIKDFVDSIL